MKRQQPDYEPYKRCFSALVIISLFTAVSFGQSASDYYSQGVSNENAGNLDAALTNFTKAIQLKPDYAYAYYKRGNVKDHKGDLNGAVADYTRAIELKPIFRWPIAIVPARKVQRVI